MEGGTKEVRSIVQKVLPKTFGVIMNGWSDGHGSHLVAIFAAFMVPENVHQALLAVVPLLNGA